MSKRLRACDICDAMKADLSLFEEVICQRCHGVTCGSSTHTRSHHQYSNLVGCNAAKDLIRELSIPGAALDAIASHLNTMWNATASVEVRHAIVALFLKEFTYIQQIQLAYLMPNTLAWFLEYSATFDTVVRLVSRGTLPEATIIAMHTDIQSGVLAQANITVGTVFWLSFAEVIRRLQESSIEHVVNGFVNSTLPEGATLFGVTLDDMEQQVVDALRLSSFLFVRHVIGTSDFIAVMQTMCNSNTLANFLTNMRVPALRFIRESVKGSDLNRSLVYLINMAILNEATSLSDTLGGYPIQPVAAPSSSATIEESAMSSPSRGKATNKKKKARLSLDLFREASYGIDDLLLDDALQSGHTTTTTTTTDDPQFEWGALFGL